MHINAPAARSRKWWRDMKAEWPRAIVGAVVAALFSAAGWFGNEIYEGRADRLARDAEISALAQETCSLTDSMLRQLSTLGETVRSRGVNSPTMLGQSPIHEEARRIWNLEAQVARDNGTTLPEMLHRLELRLGDGAAHHPTFSSDEIRGIRRTGLAVGERLLAQSPDLSHIDEAKTHLVSVRQIVCRGIRGAASIGAAPGGRR